MSGLRGRSGANPKRIFTYIYRISLYAPDSDLLPFFEQLNQLPPGRRNVALLAAIRGGAAAGQQELARTESRKVSSALDHLSTMFDFDE